MNLNIKFPLLVCGFPAAGKSTFSSFLSSRGFRILEWDSLIEEFGSKEELAEEKEFAAKLFKERMRYLKPDVVVDVFQSRKDRQAAIEAFGGRLNAAVMSCSLETCIERNSRRGELILSNDELKSIAYSFEPLETDEGFKEIYIIDGEAANVDRI